MKIFIAGHKGMVGSSVVREFKKKKFGKIILRDKKRLNLLNFNAVNNFIKKNKPDIIINCAGRVGGILANSKFPTEFLNENIQIQSNLINSAYKNDVNNFINLGSSCIYPKNSKQPIKEDYLLSSRLEKTNEAYALAKITGLKLCEYYNMQYGKSYLTLMPCNLYGPNDNFDPSNSHFIPALIRKITNSKVKNIKKTEIWGTGNPKREVMHVDDLASVIYFITKLKIKGNKKLISLIKKNSLINVGSGVELKIKQFAEVIKKIIKTESKLVYNTNYPDGTPRKVLNNSKIRSLGWKPKIALNRGLRETIKWYRERYIFKKNKN
jgi:GDP-L-fucose synthase